MTGAGGGMTGAGVGVTGARLGTAGRRVTGCFLGGWETAFGCETAGFFAGARREVEGSATALVCRALAGATDIRLGGWETTLSFAGARFDTTAADFDRDGWETVFGRGGSCDAVAGRRDVFAVGPERRETSPALR